VGSLPDGQKFWGRGGMRAVAARDAARCTGCGAVCTARLVPIGPRADALIGPDANAGVHRRARRGLAFGGRAVPAGHAGSD